MSKPARAALEETYAYTRGDRLSSSLANGRISTALANLADFKGKRVIDLGCGNGAYSALYLDWGAAEVLATDTSREALKIARKSHQGRPQLRFRLLDVGSSRAPKRKYDIAVLRGVIHHLEDPAVQLATICSMANVVLVMEPNGYNPVMKVIEKTSRYHIENHEKSYAPWRLVAWFKARGGQLAECRYIGLVPMFSPDWLARLGKRIEPLIEATPGLRQLCCGQVVMRIDFL